MKIIASVMLAIAVVLANQAAAQTGSVVGLVVDEQSGEPLVGANVLLVGTTLGTNTDLDGTFEVRNVPPGAYRVRVSYVGYTAKVIEGVRVRVEEKVMLHVSLRADGYSVDEVVVTAEAVMSGEAVLISQQRKANAIQDGISQEQIRKSPDATSSDALRRVVGLSVVDNKFVYIRGTGERYNSTQLNGVRVSSTEPDRKAFAFDIIPANLLDNIVVSKTFTPDMPGDFAGGNVQMNTMDFPQSSTFGLAIAPSTNSATTGREINSYDTGPRDWLGTDGGHRSLPDAFPSSFNGLSADKRNELGRELKNLWVVKPRSAPAGSSFSINYGNTAEVMEHPFGFNAAFSHRQGYRRTDISRADYDDAGLRYEYTGSNSKYEVLWGGILNVGYKIGTHNKVGIRSLVSRTSEDEVVRLEGFNNLTQNDDILTGFRFVSRDLLTTQLTGDHVLPELFGISLRWTAAYSEAERDEPDLRRMIYSRSRELPGAEYEAQIPYNESSPESSSRFFSKLFDYNRGVDFHLTVPIVGARLKGGGAINTARRDFTARQFVYTLPSFNPALTRSSLDTLFIPEHVGGQGGLQFSEYLDPRNRYQAHQDVAAAYAMVDLPFELYGTAWRAVAGARIEESTHHLQSRDLQNEDVDVVYNETDILPSLNLTYQIRESINLRVGYSVTVNRPEFRELAPFSFYDFSSQLTYYGNPSLIRARVRNYDMRFEVYPAPGELLSISYFRKDISDAIEQIVVSTVALAGERTYANVPSAENYGVELEMRKSLAFLGTYMKNVSVVANYARIFSKVEVGDRTRTLQGQSPYTINLGLYFTEPALGTSVGVLFNKFGERLSEVATVFQLDVKEQPRELIDVTVTQELFDILELKFTGKDILRQEQRFMQGNELVRSNKGGSSYSLGLSLRL